MLARLAELEGVRTAQTNRGGDLLRLSLDHERARAAALDLLISLGYGAEPALEPLAVTTWYDASSVGELSRIEAGVIADRVLPRLESAQAIDAATAAALRAALVKALHRCFLTNALGPSPSSGTFRDECVSASVAAAIPLLGAQRAATLGRLVEADMREVHRADPA